MYSPSPALTMTKKRTRLFRCGNSLAVRIPAAFAFADRHAELEIKRVGDELRLRPVRRSLADALEKFASFTPGFTVSGRDRQTQRKREAL